MRLPYLSPPPLSKEAVNAVAEPEAEYGKTKLQGCSWVSVYEGLKAEIKLRHYSPKTLTVYQSWMRKFQTFVKSKDSGLLTQEDVNVLPVLLLYGCGLRISECLNLRLQDFNLDAGMLTVHNGKGQKDRTVPLPQSILPQIKRQFEAVSALYDADTAAGYAGVFLPDSLGEKYKNAGKELSWQWFFPAKTLTFVSETKVYKRYHLHDTHLQKAITKEGVRSLLLHQSFRMQK